MYERKIKERGFQSLSIIILTTLLVFASSQEILNHQIEQ